MNRITQKSSSNSPLTAKSGYMIFCFAEDDWQLQANNAPSNSVSYSPPAGPNKVRFSTVVDLKDTIGEQITLT